ncbi:Peptide ABC transporter [Hyphomicrobiales bacterium]|nr:Peptide ABC transporter [Hyphomicrobiales bacterium]
MTIRGSRLIAFAAAAQMILSTMPAFAQATPQEGVINIATIGEPPTLDPATTTSDVVSIITQHVFETLYTFTKRWDVAPLLAEAMPRLSDDGMVYTIPIRDGVKFHNGKVMSSDDVVASLKRWSEVSARGKLAAAVIEQITAKDASTVEIKLKQPFAPLLPLLAMNNGAAAIIPQDIAQAGSPIKDFVGTGPYKLLEHRPDQYVRMVRFDDYVSPPGKPDGYAGERKAIVRELRFAPVPNATTRVSGMLSGQFQFADSLPSETISQFEGNTMVKPLTAGPAWPFVIINNTKSKLTGNPLIRQAMLAALNTDDLLAAAFGSPNFFDVSGSIYSDGTIYFDPTTPGYNKPDTKKAAALLKEAGYKGETLRLITSQQFDFMYKMALVAKQQLEDVGFKVELLVMDWASVVRQREDPTAWDAFTSYNTFVPEPSLLTFINPSYAGWWDTPEKRAALAAFNKEMDPNKRVELWKGLQALLYKQASTLIVGQFRNLSAISAKLDGYEPMPWSAFWNVSIRP